jgi:hypothetical protein
MYGLASIVAAIAVSIAHADDSIRVRYFTGDSFGSVSTEMTEVVVSRSSAIAAGAPQQAIDKYFASVRAALEAAGPPNIWELMAPPHSNEVRVEIALGARKYRLSAMFDGDSFPELLPDTNRSASDLRHAKALREVLRLTSEHVRGHLVGGGR